MNAPALLRGAAAAALLAAAAAAAAQTSTSLDAKVQAPQLAAPQRGSLVGQLSSVAFGPGDVSRGAFALPSPFAVPSERGELLARVFPAYAQDAGVSEWGAGWHVALAVTRARLSGDVDYATDELSGPWGRMVQGADGAWYTPGLSPPVRLLWSGDAMTAYLPDGTRYAFGGAARVANARGTYAWHLVSVTTATGRRTALTWAPNGSGRLFLQSVAWGGVADDAQYRADFAYEPIATPFVDYRSGFPLLLDQRVRRVTVLALDAVSLAFEERWHHDVAYDEEGFGPGFYLARVQQVFRSGEAPPPATYAYNLSRDRLAATTLDASGTDRFDPNGNVVRILEQFGNLSLQPDHGALVDVDEDALPDLESATDYTLAHQTPAGVVFEPLPAAPGASPLCRRGPSAANPPRLLAQLRGGAGDETAYVVDLRLDGTRANTLVTVCDRLGQVVASALAAGDWAPSPTVRLVDLDRDRRPDLVRVQAGSYRVLRNTSTAAAVSFATVKVGALSPAVTPDTLWVHDVNGDGIPDLVVRYASNVVVYHGKGNLEFAPGQTMPLRTASGAAFPQLGLYAFSFVDANKDGLVDLLLSRPGASYLLMNRGASFQEAPSVPALRGVGALVGPYVWDAGGSGNTQLVYRGSDATTGRPLAFGIALDGPETALLASADDGRGTRLSFAYARAAPVAGALHRQPVLARLSVESSGRDPVSYAYAYAGPRLHSVGKFLVGFDQVQRTDPLVTHAATFFNDDRYAGLPLGAARHDATAPGADAFQSTSYADATFQGLAWKRVAQQVSGWQDGAGARSAEQVDFVDWTDDFCPRTVKTTSAAGSLTVTRSYVHPAAFGAALSCVWSDAIEQGAHPDPALDFTHETALAHNAAGLVEAVESVDGASRWTLQTVAYRPDGLVDSISSPGKGTARFAYDPVTHLLARSTSPDGVVVEAIARDPLHDGIQTLRTTRGALVASRFFAFDGQERLRSAWDDQGASSALDPTERYAYQPATATEPASVSSSILVDPASASARDQVSLLTAAGEPVGTATRIPEGWAFGALATRSPATGTTRHLLRAGAPATVDPSALDYPSLLSGAAEVASEVTSPVQGDVVDARTLFHAGVGQRVTKAFALSGGLVRVTATENDAYATTTFTDAARRVLAFEDEAGARYGYTYDALGRVRQVTLPDGRGHRARVDGHGRVWRVERDGVANVEIAFDAATGLPTSKTFLTPSNAPVRSVAFAYDAVGRLTVATYTDAATGATAAFRTFYDGATPADPAARSTPGLVTATSGDGYTKLFTYRADGLLARRTVALGGWRTVDTALAYLEGGVLGSRTTTVYDAGGRALSSTAQSYVYGPYGRLQSVVEDGATLVTLGYDANGLLASATFANGDALSLSYDALTRRLVQSAQRTATYAASAAQRMSARGLVDGETFTVGATSLSRTYGYSAQRFLTSAADAQTSYGYGFDPFGLPTSVTRNGVARAIAPAGPCDLVAGGVAYACDGLGRTIQRGDLTLAYGPDGQLATATRGATTWTFKHDEAGERVLKLAGATPVAAYLDEGYLDATGLWERFQLGGRTVGLLRDGVFTSLATDARGTPMAEESGTPRIASPFGQRDVHTASAAALDYVEKGFDADLGLVRMGVRDYDPEINRFTTPDPLMLEAVGGAVAHPLAANLYGYARNAPTAFVDPTGLLPDEPGHEASPRTYAILNRAEAQGLPILQAIIASPTLRPSTVEAAAMAGRLTRFDTHPGSSFLGTVGEALVKHDLESQSGGVFAKVSSYATLQPGKVLPEWARSAVGTNMPDLLVTQIGGRFSTPFATFEQRVSWRNTFGPDTGGRLDTVTHAPGTVVSVWELTVTRNYEYMLERAERVAGWAAALKSANSGQVTAAAVLGLDRGAFFQLSADQQATLVRTVTGAGGYISLVRDLNQTATRDAYLLSDAIGGP